MNEGDGQKIGHPKQRKSYDLSQDPRELRRDGKKAPILAHGSNADCRNPEDIMRSMGFEPSKHMNPLQFLLAVMNDDLDTIFKNDKRKKRIEGKGGISLSYRVECAKTASKYIHMEMPKVQIQKGDGDGFGQSLADAIEQGNDRVRTRRIIMEEVERISPDIPLAPASYPPAFEDAILNEPTDEMAEGDTDYDPDAE